MASLLKTYFFDSLVYRVMDMATEFPHCSVTSTDGGVSRCAASISIISR